MRGLRFLHASAEDESDLIGDLSRSGDGFAVARRMNPEAGRKKRTENNKTGKKYAGASSV